MNNLDIWKKRKKELGLTLGDISKMTGIGISAIKDIFRGATYAPRIDTVQAIEKALALDGSWTQEEIQDGVVASIKRTVNAQQSELLDIYEDLSDEKKDLLIKIAETMLEDKN